MSRPAYWIQLAQTLHHKQPHYRAKVYDRHNRLVATTPTLWPLNAGCGQAAAIGEAEAIIQRIQANQFTESMRAAGDFANVPISPAVIDIKGETIMTRDYLFSYVVTTIIGVILAFGLAACLGV